MAKFTDQDALAAIEIVVGGEEMTDIEMDLARGRIRGRNKKMAEKILRVYEISHAFNAKHSCHHVHGNWRNLPELKAAEPSHPEGRN